MERPHQVVGGHINSDYLLKRQAETYEAKLAALGELLESEKQLALENQTSKYQLKIAELEDIIYETSKQHAELAAEKERLERALPSSELLASDLRTKPVTERANELADDLDRCTEKSFVRLMHSVDGQVFSGYRQYPSIYDEDILGLMEQAADLCADHMNHAQDSVIILGGAGTSGRLAYFIANEFNAIMEACGKTPCFRYCIAGGDAAIFRTIEGAEDDPAAAVHDLEIMSTSSSGSVYQRVLYFGITCGLSATYVGAQLEHSMAHPQFAAVLVGFNPMQVAEKLYAKGMASPVNTRRHLVLTPVVGPEAVQGSTRLKGGSATKIIMESIFAVAASSSLKLPLMGGVPVLPKQIVSDVYRDGNSDKSSFGEMFFGFMGGLNGAQSKPAAAATDGSAVDRGVVFHEPLLAYEAAMQAVYTTPLHKLVTLATETLRAGRHVWYIGPGSLALVGMIDASEQVPTFGARAKDVRAFVSGGTDAMGLKGHAAVLPDISLDTFVTKVLPTSNTSDLVVVLLSEIAGDVFPESLSSELYRLKRANGFQLVTVEVKRTGVAEPDRDQMSSDEVAMKKMFSVTNYRHVVPLPLAACKVLLPGLDVYGELAVKVVLNVITTGAFVRLGKVYRSRMIDMRVSNIKLYHRACTIIASITGVGLNIATECIIRAIHDVDIPKPLPKNLWDLPVHDHLTRAPKVNQLVPTAILVATGKYTLAEARRDLREGVAIRDLVVAAMPGSD